MVFSGNFSKIEEYLKHLNTKATEFLALNVFFGSKNSDEIEILFYWLNFKKNLLSILSEICLTNFSECYLRIVVLSSNLSY